MDLSNDEFQSSRLVFSILNLLLLETRPSEKYPINVPEKYSLTRFQKRIIRKKDYGWTILKTLSKAIANFSGLGGPIEALIDARSSTIRDKNNAAEEILSRYVNWIGKQSLLVLAIDNYQFMNREIKHSLESILRKSKGNIAFIIVDRTFNNISESSPSLFDFHNEKKIIELFPFSKVETYSLIKKSITSSPDNLKKISEDIYTKTLGLPKDIEYCVQQYNRAFFNKEPKAEILGLLSTLDRLPLMHQQFLMIVSLLDGGISEQLAINAVLRIDGVSNYSEVKNILDELIALEYLKINSTSGDKLRPGHERIVQATREIINEEVLHEVRGSLINEIEKILDTSNRIERQDYLLHCFIGLQTANELRNKLHYISRLVRTQHRKEQFAYLVSISEELMEIISIFPESTVILILDSFQKSSAFDKGLQIINLLEEKTNYINQDLLLFKFKFLTQLYQYEQAKPIMELLDNESWNIVYKTNLLMALENNEKAKEIIEGVSSKLKVTKEYEAIIMRNTVTLFPSKLAMSNLNKAEKYFSKLESEYRLATIETNKSLVYICQGSLGDSLKVLNKSIIRMESIDSNEIYQPYINIAVTYVLLGKYNVAIEYFKKASNSVPRNLLLDQIKIEVNKIITKYLENLINNEMALSCLKELFERIKGIEMPYLRRIIKHNMNVLNSKKESRVSGIEGFLANNQNVSLYVPVKLKKDSSRFLVIIPSVHWRY